MTSSFPHHLLRNKILRQHAMGSLRQCEQGAGSRATYAESADVLLFLDHDHDRLNHHARLQTQRIQLLGLTHRRCRHLFALVDKDLGHITCGHAHRFRSRTAQPSCCRADGHAHSFWQSKDTVALSVSMSQ